MDCYTGDTNYYASEPDTGNEHRRKKKSRHDRHNDRTHSDQMHSLSTHKKRVGRSLKDRDARNDGELPFFMMDSTIRAAIAEREKQQRLDRREAQRAAKRSRKDKKLKKRLKRKLEKERERERHKSRHKRHRSRSTSNSPVTSTVEKADVSDGDEVMKRKKANI